MNATVTVVTIAQILFELPIMPATRNSIIGISVAIAVSANGMKVDIPKTVCCRVWESVRHVVCVKLQIPTTKAFATGTFLRQPIFGPRIHLGVIQECLRMSVIHVCVHAAIVAGPINLSSSNLVLLKISLHRLRRRWR